DPQGAPGDVGLVLEASAHARQVAYRKAGRPVDAFALTGQLAWNSVLRKSSDTLSGRGNLAFTDAALTVGGEKVTLERLALDHDVTYDRRAGTLSLRTARLVSPALNLDIKGAVRDLGTNPLAAIAGTYSVDWEKLTPLLHQLDDRTPTSLAALKGARGEFHFDRGPDGVAAGAAFTGDLGALDVQLNAPRLSALRAIDVSAVLAAARAGEPLPPLPEAHVKLTGRLDLGVLFAATPPEAVQASHPHPTSGVLEFRDVACSLGAKPALGGAIVLSNVAALFEGQTSPWTSRRTWPGSGNSTSPGCTARKPSRAACV
ncbi:MAG: hypothetical protein NTV86_16655, partial [Planctomycetota bacterium]|nr:hypothetical protein [Planctomycetota bacterium]